MNKKSETLAKEATEHSAEAVEFLKESNNVHQLSKQGIIEEDEAVEKAVDLNNRAIAETEKAIELQKEFIAAQESE